jgi:hypothetical protein
VSDDGHVPDVGRPVHELTDLRDGEAVEVIVSLAVFIREPTEKSAKRKAATTYLTISTVFLKTLKRN